MPFNILALVLISIGYLYSQEKGSAIQLNEQILAKERANR
jgi:hypothetical protein